MITIREALPSDKDFICTLAKKTDLWPLTDRGRYFVAFSNDNNEITPLGFIRITNLDGAFYVEPVAVVPELHRQGVGRALMCYAREKFGALRFVARGAAIPFYKRLRCRNITWEDISPTLVEECAACSMRESCQPQPMLFV